MAVKVYTWQCNHCQHVFDVERQSMDEYNVPPEDGCPMCDNSDPKQCTKLISKQSPAIKKGDGWHDTEYTKYRSIK